MSEMDLGGEVKLTVSQLRVYLDCQKRHASTLDIIFKDGNGYQDRFMCGEAEGIREAVKELLKCLNLPENWAETMDVKEAHEVHTHALREEF